MHDDDEYEMNGLTFEDNDKEAEVIDNKEYNKKKIKVIFLLIVAAVAIATVILYAAMYIIKDKRGQTGTQKTVERVEIVGNESLKIEKKTKNDVWVVIDKADVGSDIRVIESVYNISKIEHLAYNIHGSNAIQLKTRLIGSIDGIDGNEIIVDIPYDKGIKLIEGVEFKVRVYVEVYKDKLVIINIEY